MHDFALFGPPMVLVVARQKVCKELQDQKRGIRLATADQMACHGRWEISSHTALAIYLARVILFSRNGVLSFKKRNDTSSDQQICKKNNKFVGIFGASNWLSPPHSIYYFQDPLLNYSRTVIILHLSTIFCGGVVWGGVEPRTKGNPNLPLTPSL